VTRVFTLFLLLLLLSMKPASSTHPPPSSPSSEQFEDGSSELGELVNQQGCGAVYASLESCLERTSRNFTKCQAEVKLLQKCYENFNKLKQSNR